MRYYLHCFCLKPIASDVPVCELYQRLNSIYIAQLKKGPFMLCTSEWFPQESYKAAALDPSATRHSFRVKL